MVRRRLLGRYAILGAIAASLAPSNKTVVATSTATNAPDTNDIPYGTPRLLDTDVAKLEASIANQLKRDGIKIPRLELFEENKSAFDQFFQKLGRGNAALNRKMGGTDAPLEGVMQPAENQPLNRTLPGLARILGANEDQVVGIPPASGADYFISRATEDPSPNGILDKICTCGKQHSALEQQYPQFRVFAALHETAHYIDYAQKLNLPILVNITEKLPPQTANESIIFEANIKERIADAAATLYILSNYEDGRKLISIVSEYRDSSSEPSHYSSSTIKAAAREFDRTPRQGLSIVETTKIAAKIVTEQGVVIATEARQAAKTYDTLKAGKADPNTPDVAKVGLARRRLFGLSPNNI